MTECPDCGRNFKSAKCSCGYTPSSPENKEAAEQRMRELRYSLSKQAEVADERWKAKAAVLATVKATGGLKWAHEVIALHEAGLSPSHYGLKLARSALGLDRKEAA